MEAAKGELHQAETEIIRRIEAATIPTKNYPASRRQRLSSDSAAIAAWENEGGSMRASKRKAIPRIL
jgi:predicted phage gp36 major capsid-like protein